MKRIAAAALAALWGAAPGIADDDAPRRDLDAHEHGSGTLNIAVENGAVWMELEVPGADIVGFEHAAESAEDRQAVEAAKAVLARPLELFAFPEAAGCMVEEAHVALAGEERDEAHEGEDAHAGEDAEAHDDHDEDEGEPHNEFHAEYMLRCAAPGEIDEIGFPWFTAFPGSEELDANVTSGNGQAAFEVSRDAPAIDVAAHF